MSLDALFASAHAAMASAGADFFGALTASYTPPGGSASACSVFITQNVQVLGEFGEVVSKADEAEFDLAAVTPAHQGALTITSGTLSGTDYKLDKELENDGVSSRWRLRRV